MKKIANLILIILSICVVSIKAQAQSVDLGPYVPNNTITVDGLHYLLDDETMTAELLTLKKELHGHIIVPQYVTKKNKTYKVTSLYNYVFSDQINLTSVELPEELDELKRGVFLQCYNLKTVKMPLRLNKLGDGCFQGCINLGEITLPEGIEDINESTFRQCKKLKKLVIPKSVKRIRKHICCVCPSLKEVILLNPNTRIHKEAFDASGVEKVENWNGRTCKDRWEQVKIIEDGVVVGYNYIQNEDED